ncbi:alkaline phosphatase family protein [Leptolyngbya sp. FACHB-711]|uniref:alkaline phosphatase family protein n=1 Tax=unclassified Leptolyngbya TaxID=2650499 RepID=UPI0018EFC9D2
MIQSSNVRTVDYTVPFGTFGGLGARGFSLDAADFTVDANEAITDLTALGIQSFSDVKVAELEDIPAQGQGSLTGGSSNAYNLQAVAIDTTDDRVVNYNQLIVFDANRGIEALTGNAPSTGSAVLNTYDQTISPFFFESSNNVVGASFVLTNLAPDLSTVRLLRTSANYIPRPADNPGVLANVDDINNTVGFWRPQPDYRIPERISPGLEDFPDVELEAVYQDLVETFVDYQTDVFLRAIEQEPNADLALGYIEQPDGAEHQFLLIDPRQPSDFTNPYSIGAGQDPAKVDRYQDYVLNAYQTVSDAVQRVIDTVGVDENGDPNSNIIITSDHGFAPFHTAVNMNNILANAGFDPNEVRAVTSGPAVNIYINVKGREPDGTVDPSEYRELQQRIVQTLESIQDTNSSYALDGAVDLFDKVYERPVPENPTAEDIITARSEFIGQDTGDVFALLDLGYNFDGFQPTVLRRDDTTPVQDQQPIFSVPNFYGAHGYDPNLPKMQAIFLAAGPDFNADDFSDLDQIRSIDIAPTLLDLLGVEPAPAVEGESILDPDTGNDLEATLDALDDYLQDLIGNGSAVLADARDALINAFDDLEGDIDIADINDILNLGGDRLVNTVTDLIRDGRDSLLTDLEVNFGLQNRDGFHLVPNSNDLNPSIGLETSSLTSLNSALA